MPGFVAKGATREEAEKNMYEAIEMHIEGLLDDKLPIPESNRTFKEGIKTINYRHIYPET